MSATRTSTLRPTTRSAPGASASGGKVRDRISLISDDLRAVTSIGHVLGEASEKVAPRGSMGNTHFDADLFVAFVANHFLDKSKTSVDPSPIVAEAWQVEEFRKLLLINAAGQLDPLQWVVSWARRHGKTEWVGLYVLTRCLLYPNQVVAIQASGGEEQAEQAAFARLVELIRWSTTAFQVVEKRTRDSFSCDFIAKPEFAKQRPGRVRVDVLGGSIRFGNGSLIVVIPAGERSAYGVRLSVFWGSELHLAKDDDGYLAGKGGTGDSWCGLSIIDSTQGDAENIVARATEAGKLAEITHGKDGDTSTAVSHVCYEDLRDACQRSPSWISPAFLKSQAALMTPSAFTRNHLNRATGSGEAVFPPALLTLARNHRISHRLCQEAWPDAPGSYTPREVFREIRREFKGHGLRVGIGVDRSSGRAGRDRTVVVASALGVDETRIGNPCPVFDQHGNEIDRIPAKEADGTTILVLAVVTIPGAGKGQIKRVIRKLHKLYAAPAIAFEEYQARDLFDWAEGEGYEATLEPMTDKIKHAHVLSTTEVLTTARLALPGGDRQMFGGAGLLNVELTRYAEMDSKGAVPKYGGPVGQAVFALDGEAAEAHRVKDDSAEGFFWSTFPIRDADVDEWRM